MMMTKPKLTAATLVVILAAMFLTAWTSHLAAAEPAKQPEQSPSVRAGADVKDNLSAAEFQKLRALIKPKPGGFDDVPWMTSIWEARRKAAAEGKPILLWVGDGNPLGWT
jgi:hypothetical protein